MPTISDLDLLSPAECTQVETDICRLRKFWQRWGDAELGFYTLGAATYLEAYRYGASVYQAKAQLTNAVLQKHFAWLYDRIVGALTEHLQAPVVYQGKLALPGFHIFQNPFTSDNSEQSLDPHFDLQFRFLGKVFGLVPESDLPEVISFTLAILLPSSGGGLDVWDVSASEVGTNGGELRQQLMETRKRTYHPYRTGTMAVHSGTFLHSIAATKDRRPGDQRVTLQGHGLRMDGAWHLYW
jgi:hypothetical protein